MYRIKIKIKYLETDNISYQLKEENDSKLLAREGSFDCINYTIDVVSKNDIEYYKIKLYDEFDTIVPFQIFSVPAKNITYDINEL